MFDRFPVDLLSVVPVPRPLLALLAASVLVFALYTVALKPASGGGGSHMGAYQSAVAKARAVQGLVNGAGARDGGTPTSSAPSTSSPPAKPAPAQSSTTTTTPAGASQQGQTSSTQVHRPGHSGAPTQSTISSLAAPGTVLGTITPPHRALTAAERFHEVQVALQHHKVLALLFYNPASSDDMAVASELSAIPTHGGAVVRLGVPLQEVAAYSTLLSQVPVNYSPTLVLIDRQGQAEEIAGFAGSFEIDRRIAQLLGS